MSQPVCGIVFAPSQRNDRNASLRRSVSLNSRPKHITLDGSTATSSQGRGQGFSHTHHRSLSDKMKSLHNRMKRDNDILAGKPQAVVTSPPVTRRIPRHVDVFEAIPQNEQDDSQRRACHRNEERERQAVGAGIHRLPSNPRTNGNSFIPFNGDKSYRQIAYDQYLTQAFGLSTDAKPKPAAIQRLRAAEVPARPDSDMSAATNDSMIVNFHMSSKDVQNSITVSARDQRPKIQVTIPGKRPTSSMHLAHQMSRPKSKTRKRQMPTTVSPSSSTSSQGNGEAPARLSIVSPLSVVEMPRPRRPFSAFSLEDMTNDMPLPIPSTGKPTTSDSSDDTGDQDDRSSIYSGRSSTSSLTSVTSLTKSSDKCRHSIAFSIMSPAAAGVFDNQPLVPKLSRDLISMQSMASLAVNTNKPLPPEPGLEDVAPLRLRGRPNSEDNKFHGKRKTPTPLTISRASTVNGPPCGSSRASSLRSKYTPADLDALDAAFLKTSPMDLSFYAPPESTLEQAQLELEAHLGTIAEDDASTSGLIRLIHDPLQISRGPNEMLPSRQAPCPPSLTNLRLSDEILNGKKRLQKKPSTHVFLQMKTGSRGNSAEPLMRKRISAPVGGSLTKANRILGKVDEAVPMDRALSRESNWSSSESPETSYADSSSPNISGREESSTPETDVSSVPDYAFEEVRARLELLNPKNDYTPHSKNRRLRHWESSSAVCLQSQEQRDSPMRRKLSLTETSRFDDLSQATPTSHPVTVEDSQDLHGEFVVPLPRPSGQDSVRPRSLASIAMSEIPDIYAALPCDQSTIRDSIVADDEERTIPVDAAEKVLLNILRNLDNLQDLFSMATVSRGFYRMFKRNELPLMKNALYGMSPAAWELREMSPPYPGLLGEGFASQRLDYSPALYLQHYMRDMYTMIALKSIILIHCESFLRADTITALAGGETERASQIDDAFWRVWTFCQLFGCGSNREDDIVAQMDWLNGGSLSRRNAKSSEYANTGKKQTMFGPVTSFGHGNGSKLSAEDLYDMTEIWTCLGVLVRGFQGKRQEAREFGVFDEADITVGDIEAEDALLEEWTYHLLTLGPPTVLDVTSPLAPTAATFAHARSRGYTSWTPPIVSRATFLKEAVSRVYQERMVEKHPSSVPTSPKANISRPVSPIQAENVLASEVVASRWRCARHAAEIRAKRSAPDFNLLPTSEDRPMSNYPSVLEKLDAMDNAPPMPNLPRGHHKTPSESDTSKHMISALVVPSGPQVRDPVDIAVDKLVGMGFEPSKAKKALAETDTGNSVDFDAALEWLVRERKRDVGALMHARYQGKIGEDREEMRVVTPLTEGVGLGLGWS